METPVIIAFIGVLTTVLSWFLGRKKRNAEINSLEFQRLQKIWRDIVDYQTTEILQLRKEVAALKQEIKNLCTDCNYKKAHT